jgi:hypothetical protein
LAGLPFLRFPKFWQGCHFLGYISSSLFGTLTHTRFAAIERRLDSAAAEQRAHLHDRLWTLGLGALIGMIVMMGLLFLAWLFVNVQP